MVTEGGPRHSKSSFSRRMSAASEKMTDQSGELPFEVCFRNTKSNPVKMATIPTIARDEVPHVVRENLAVGGADFPIDAQR